MAGKNFSDWLKYMALGSTIATALAGLVGGGYLLGDFLDTRMGTDPWLKILLMISGVFLGIGYLIISLKELGKSNNEQ